MVIIFELLAVLCLSILPIIPAYIFFKRVEVKEYTRFPYLYVSISILKNLGVIFVLIFIAFQQPSQLLSLGIDFDRSNEIYLGVVILGLFWIIYTYGYKIIFGKQLELDDSRKDVQITLSHRTLGQKIICLIETVLGAIEEEMVFRGYFILLWGQRTNALIICAIFSCVIFVAGHLYQGKKMLIHHMFFAAIITVSTVLSDGIMIALGFHVFQNVVAILKMWRTDSKKKKIRPEKIIHFEPPKPVSRLAVLALVLSISGLIPFTLGIPLIAGLIVGMIANKKIQKSDGKLNGGNLANAAITISLVSITLIFCGLLLAIVLIYTLPFILSLFLD